MSGWDRHSPYRQAAPSQQSALQVTRQQLGHAQQQLGHAKQQLGHTQQQLGHTQQQLQQLQQHHERLQQHTERLQQHAESLQREADAAGALREEVQELRSELQALRDEQERLQAEARAVQPAEELEALQDRNLRLSADIANLRRHQREEIGRARQQARAELIGDFVETLDVLERALQTSDPESPWHQGSLGIKRQMEAVLRKAGAARIGEVGEAFDPHIHEALGVVHRPELPADVIAEVVSPGWRFASGTLVRPARVIVSQ